jgi:hypothetical protein
MIEMMKQELSSMAHTWTYKWNGLLWRRKAKDMLKCTYCGGTAWIGGPSGGMNQNILCANKDCRHWFDYVPGLVFEDLQKVEPTAAEAKENEKTVMAERKLRIEEDLKKGAEFYRRGRLLSDVFNELPYHNGAFAAGWLEAMIARGKE